jgi:hypothetical protein
MQRLDWMDPVDTRILDHLHQENVELSPAELADSHPYRPDYIEHRCQRLAEQGLLQPVGHVDTVYFVRELGQEFVEREVPTGLLEGSRPIKG